MNETKISKFAAELLIEDVYKTFKFTHKHLDIEDFNAHLSSFVTLTPDFINRHPEITLSWISNNNNNITVEFLEQKELIPKRKGLYRLNCFTKEYLLSEQFMDLALTFKNNQFGFLVDMSANVNLTLRDKFNLNHKFWMVNEGKIGLPFWIDQFKHNNALYFRKTNILRKLTDDDVLFMFEIGMIKPKDNTSYMFIFNTKPKHNSRDYECGNLLKCLKIVNNNSLTRELQEKLTKPQLAALNSIIKDIRFAAKSNYVDDKLICKYIKENNLDFETKRNILYDLAQNHYINKEIMRKEFPKNRSFKLPLSNFETLEYWISYKKYINRKSNNNNSYNSNNNEVDEETFSRTYFLTDNIRLYFVSFRYYIAINKINKWYKRVKYNNITFKNARNNKYLEVYNIVL